MRWFPLEYQVGQLVYSKSGRDKGRLMMVVSMETNFLMLVDGKHRKIDKPKKKKIIHLQPTSYVDNNLANKIGSCELVLNSDIRKTLKSFVLKEKM